VRVGERQQGSHFPVSRDGFQLAVGGDRQACSTIGAYVR
jgi:hypothetical protein